MVTFVANGTVSAAGDRAASRSGAFQSVSVRHHTWTMKAGPKSLELEEQGPRFELRPYQIRLGTIDQGHAEVEWVVRAHTRTSKRSRLTAEE